ncbi:MAG: aliphatic sulfonate transporter [Hyphomicrobiales bacterium]|nr:aliphatic sulfonate transporter [Hyphomicrobiales bacterium]
MSKARAALIFALALAALPAQAKDAIKIAAGARGNWETAAAEMGVVSGIFDKHGLQAEVLWTQGSGETLQATAAGSADVGIGLGLAAAMSAWLKGAPILPIANASTGPDLYWYVPAASPIASLKDAAGKTMAYSTTGSSSYMALIALGKLYNVNVKPTGTGNPAATLAQVMSGQVDIGWAGPPFGIDQVEAGKLRIVAREEELPDFQNQTARIMVSPVSFIRNRPQVLSAFRAAYAETIEWMYASPDAMKAYTAFSGISPDVTKRVREEFFPKKALELNRLAGVNEGMRDAVEMKFLPAPLTKEQQDAFFASYAR